MRENLVRKVGERGQDNLIAGLFPRAFTMGIKIAAGEGELRRGTLLAANADGAYIMYGKGTAVSEGETPQPSPTVPSAILVEDVDASGSAAVTAVAYRSGNFNPAEVIVSEGYTLTAADKDALRKYDIIFTDMLED